MTQTLHEQDLTSMDGVGYDDDGTDDSSSTGGTADSQRWLELRCVLAIIRHGDRTPKQKMKVTVTQVRLGQERSSCTSVPVSHATIYLQGHR